MRAVILACFQRKEKFISVERRIRLRRVLTRLSEEAMDTGVEVKVEEYDGTYECLFCGESVRGQPALKCSQCSSNPFHLACVALAHSKYAEVCPTCDRKTV